MSTTQTQQLLTQRRFRDAVDKTVTQTKQLARELTTPKSNSFFNLAQKLNRAKGTKVLKADTMLQHTCQSAITGCAAGAAAGYTIGVSISASIGFADMGLSALNGLWKGALIGAFTGIVMGTANYKTTLVNNLTSNLIRNKENFQPMTQAVITDLETAIENRKDKKLFGKDSLFKDVCKFNLAGLWHTFNQTEYKKACRAIVDNSLVMADINLYFSLVPHAKPEIDKEGYARME